MILKERNVLRNLIWNSLLPHGITFNHAFHIHLQFGLRNSHPSPIGQSRASSHTHVFLVHMKFALTNIAIPTPHVYPTSLLLYACISCSLGVCS